MNKVIWKWFSYYEKEEIWLNEMVAQGFALKKYTFCRYVFEPCEPNAYIYRIDLLKHNLNNPKTVAYLDFMEETGVEYVTSYFRWIYFRKKASDGPFEIYSDINSKLAYYHRISTLWCVIGTINVLIWLVHLIQDPSLLINSSLLNLAAGCLLLILSIPYFIKARQLKKEKQLRD